MFEDKADLNTRIKILIKESDFLLGENDITENQFNKFKNQVNKVLNEVIKSDLNEDIKRNAFRALKPYSGEIKFDFFPLNWFYKILLAKVAWDDNMPFLIGKSKSDRLQSQIPKIKIQLEAINFKMNNL